MERTVLQCACFGVLSDLLEQVHAGMTDLSTGHSVVTAAMSHWELQLQLQQATQCVWYTVKQAGPLEHHALPGRTERGRKRTRAHS
jgi:hypothetical protein